MSLLAFSSYYGRDGDATLPFVILFIGVIAFLLFVSHARLQAHAQR